MCIYVTGSNKIAHTYFLRIEQTEKNKIRMNSGSLPFLYLSLKMLTSMMNIDMQQNERHLIKMNQLLTPTCCNKGNYQCDQPVIE